MGEKGGQKKCAMLCLQHHPETELWETVTLRLDLQMHVYTHKRMFEKCLSIVQIFYFYYKFSKTILI